MNMTDVAALHARIAQLERAQARRSQSRRRAWLLAALCTGLLLALAPLGLLAGNNQQFADVDPNSVHAPNIVAIRQAGITTGCNPGANLYCPSAYVRRDEMASFLARTAGIGTNPPVVNALTAVNATNATNAGHASSADNAANAANADYATNAGHAASADIVDANTVDGYAPNGLVRVARGSAYPDGGGVPLSTTAYTSIASVTINVPGPGFVLVTGMVSPYDTSTSTFSATLTRLRDTAPGGAVSPDQWANANQVAGNTRNYSVGSTWVFPVSAAGAKTYVIEVLVKIAGNGGTYASNGQLTALYIPFGSTGTGTLGPNDPAPSGPAAPGQR
ncbi:MAG: hypothetical protein ACTHMU_12985 [Thermomicrobiales bacterium]